MAIDWKKEIGDLDNIGEWLKDAAQEFSKKNIKAAVVIIVVEEEEKDYESMIMRSNYGNSPMALLTAIRYGGRLLDDEQLDSFSSESSG